MASIEETRELLLELATSLPHPFYVFKGVWGCKRCGIKHKLTKRYYTELQTQKLRTSCVDPLRPLYSEERSNVFLNVFYVKRCLGKKPRKTISGWKMNMEKGTP